MFISGIVDSECGKKKKKKRVKKKRGNVKVDGEVEEAKKEKKKVVCLAQLVKSHDQLVKSHESNGLTLAQRVLAKESQLHLAQKELHKLKERLQNVETIKAQEATELERAKRTVEDLSQKLKAVNEAKELSTKAT